ncbi:hypothetical protein CC78DRAFT_349930 [Lojkania enalia]|uniref:Uncharacterized protein n=1 Tax=Lojkania enalia TaxID=147567 RepID=A0A9P4K5Y4_9PLEO|nr:hypothetical protein CC78DRAFT_349930 [Didymosphaeria enalia]
MRDGISVAVTCFIFFAASSANVLPSPSISDPTITPPPQSPNIELLRKQNDNRFMGWISYSFWGWSSERCNLGGTLYQSGDYWRCCATTDDGCNVPLGCVGGSLVYSITTGTEPSRTTVDCTSVYTSSIYSTYTICNSGFLYENTDDSSPQTNIFCGDESVNWSYYRVIPETWISPPASTSSSTSRSSTPRSSPVSTTSSSSASETPTIIPAQEEKKESQAWIAGPVVGGVAALAIVGAIFWFLLRRKKKADANANTSQPPPTAAPAYYAGSPNAPPTQPYGSPPMQQQGGFMPYGVAKHESWQPTSPGSHGSHSPIPPNSPYGPLSHSPTPQGVQNWQPVQQAASPQMLTPQAGYQQSYDVDQGAVTKAPNEVRVDDQPIYVPPDQQPSR